MTYGIPLEYKHKQLEKEMPGHYKSPSSPRRPRFTHPLPL